MAEIQTPQNIGKDMSMFEGDAKGTMITQETAPPITPVAAKEEPTVTRGVSQEDADSLLKGLEGNSEPKPEAKAPKDISKADTPGSAVNEWETKYTTLQAQHETFRKRNEELEVEHALVATFNADPIKFIQTNFPQFVYQSTEKTLPEKLVELRTKFGRDFDYDPVRAKNDPTSEDAKYEMEYDTVKTAHIREEAERSMGIKMQTEKMNTERLESTRSALAAIDSIKKEYGITDEQLTPYVEQFEQVRNNVIKNFESWLRLSVKANFGLNNQVERLKAQEQIEKQKKTSPSLSDGGKSGSKQDDVDPDDWSAALLYRTTRS